MKNKQTSSVLFGVKQEEMAAILQISRGLWSMYESGKRDLPQKAYLELVRIQNFMALAKAEVAKNNENKDLERTELEKLLTENKYQQAKAIRQLATAEKKLESGINALHMVNYLTSQSDTKRNVVGFSGFIADRAKKDIQQNGIPALIRLKIKLQVLQHEEKLLKTALK